MSHNSIYSQMISDKELFFKEVKKIGGTVEEFATEQEVTMFGRNQATAIAAIKLPGWKYNIALTKEGNLVYDHWGSQSDSMAIFHAAITNYNENVIAKNIPLDLVSNSWTEMTKDGEKKIILEYN